MKIQVGKDKRFNVSFNNNDLLFLRFYNCRYFEGGPGANVSNAFVLNAALLGYPGYFLELDT